MASLSDFSEADYAALAKWLGHRRSGITDIVELEGFLTAIVIGPRTVSPMAWLPKIWGGKAPKFASLEELNRFVALVMAYYNDLARWFALDPDRFEPTFYEHEAHGPRVVIVDEWCTGFLKGMRVDPKSWIPLKKAAPHLLKPLQLFGSPAGWAELEAGGEAKTHKHWSPKVAPAVRAIHQFWLRIRLAELQASGDQTTH